MAVQKAAWEDADLAQEMADNREQEVSKGLCEVSVQERNSSAL